jgi:hypothetical protein
LVDLYLLVIIILFGFRLILIQVEKGGVSYAKKTLKNISRYIFVILLFFSMGIFVFGTIETGLNVYKLILYVMIITMLTCLGLVIGCKKDKNKENENEENDK